MDSKKRAPGRPRVHEVGRWTSVQFRIPIDLRKILFTLLDQKNEKLAYRLSLNSLLLELIESSLKLLPEAPKSQQSPFSSSEEHLKEVLSTTASSLNSK